LRIEKQGLVGLKTRLGSPKNVKKFFHKQIRFLHTCSNTVKRFRLEFQQFFQIITQRCQVDMEAIERQTTQMG
jgi:hypothetical protein